MTKNHERKENKEIKGSLGIKQNDENLEISSTGYGYESGPQKSKQQK